MEVHLTAEAERDLTEIALFIARDNIQRAMDLVQLLRTACLDLAEFPDRFPLVPRYARRGIRHRVCGNYLIFYRREQRRVAILHILHGARDYLDLLGTME